MHVHTRRGRHDGRRRQPAGGTGGTVAPILAKSAAATILQAFCTTESGVCSRRRKERTTTKEREQEQERKSNKERENEHDLGMPLDITCEVADAPSRPFLGLSISQITLLAIEGLGGLKAKSPRNRKTKHIKRARKPTPEETKSDETRKAKILFRPPHQLCLRAAKQQKGASPATAMAIGSGSAALNFKMG